MAPNPLADDSDASIATIIRLNGDDPPFSTVIVHLLSIEFLLQVNRRAEPAAKCLRRQTGDGGVAAGRHRILDVLNGQPNHVLARNLIRLRRDIHHPYSRPSAGGIHHLIERDRREPSMLNRHHSRRASIEKKLRRAIAEISGVFHVEGNRVGTA